MTDRLSELIERVVDGRIVDWETAFRDVRDSEERAAVQDLRGLAQLAEQDGLRDRLDADADQSVGVSAPSSSYPPRRWGHLEILEEIGRGAYGVVYRAWDTRLARHVALKLLFDEEGRSIDEARRLAQVSHPHVVTVFGADRIGGQVGVWMELLGGRTLDEILTDAGPLSEREAMVVAVDICSAVAAIHAVGLLHRDIKAQNVMRERGGRLVLMDMGTSLAMSDVNIATASLAGTPLYMAPELFEGSAPSVASDIYAVGVLLYRMASGQFPIEGRTLSDVRRAHADMLQRPLRAARPDLGPAFVRIVERCISPQPTSRYQSIAALEQALHEAAGRDAAFVARKRYTVAWRMVIGAVALAAVTGSALTWWLLTARAIDNNERVSSPTPSISSDQYKIFAGYEELAFGKRIEDPTGAAAATRGALSQVRLALPGQHGAFALLYARLADSSRRTRDLVQAQIDALDASAHVTGSVGDNHPYAAVVAFESARNAQAAGDHRTAAANVLRGLEMRARVLGLSELGQRPGPPLDAAELERQSRGGFRLEDSDSDGLHDLIEQAAGLNPRAIDSNHNGVSDQDDDHDGDGVSNRLTLGLVGDPFLTWAHFGAQQPRFLAWQIPPQFPALEQPEPDSRHPAWAVTADHSMTLFFQRLAHGHSDRALERGFSLFIRAQPIHGLTSLVVSASPGPRFDLALRPHNERSVEALLLSSVVPRQGEAVRIDTPPNGRWPLLELRYNPRDKSASLFVNGRQSLGDYRGHRQYQDPQPGEGSVVWGLGPIGDGGDLRAAAKFSLVWLEIF